MYEGNERNYLRVANGDIELLGNAIHQMRGRRTLAEYSMDCGFCGRRLSTVTGKEVLLPYVSEDLVRQTVRNQVPEAGIHEESLMAANGCVTIDFMEALRRKILKDGLNDGGIGHGAEDGASPKHFRKHKDYHVEDPEEAISRMEEALSEKEKEDGRYVGFLMDLSKFSLALTVDECNILRRHTHRLSEDMFFCEALREYCRLVEYDEKQDMENLRKYFNGETEEAPKWAEESKVFFDTLYDLVFHFM